MRGFAQISLAAIAIALSLEAITLIPYQKYMKESLEEQCAVERDLNEGAAASCDRGGPTGLARRLTLAAFTMLATGLFIAAATGRTAAAVLILSATAAALTASHVIKLHFLGEPVYLVDFHFATLRTFSAVFWGLSWPVKAAFVLVVILLSSPLFFAVRSIRRTPAIKVHVRIILGVCGIAGLLVPMYKIANGMPLWLYLGRVGISHLNHTQTFYNTGPVGFLLHDLREKSGRKSANNRYRQVIPLPAAPPPEMKIKPDIFVILAESVWDPRRLDALQGIADPMPYFHRKMDENGGYVEVPAYGGGTPKTEFEVLTGLSSLEIGGYPYVAALYRPTRSLATVFAKHGYQTRYAHAYKEWMFNRGNAIPRMGFERAYFEKELRQLAKIPPRPDTYFDDHSFLQFLCALPQGDKPFFVAAATYGTHGPYADRPVAAEKLPGHIAMHRKDAASLAKNLALLHRFDLALKSFSDCLRARKRPAVFMVYGDHWPNYSYFDFSLIWSDAPASAYTETPYFIAAENFRLPKLNAGFTSTNWLHLDILEAAGAGDDFVARELRQLRTALPVLGVYKLDRKKLVKQFGPSAFVESQLGQYRELTDAVMHLGLGL